MPLTVPSDLATAADSVPLYGATQAGKLPGASIVYASLAALNAAISKERANIAIGSPIWVDGQQLATSTEAAQGVHRVWSAVGQHARNVILRPGAAVLLGGDTNAVLFGAGLPAAGTGNSGDLSVDGAANAYYTKTSGTWALTGAMTAPDPTTATSLAGKADTTTVNTALGLKADTTTVNAALLLKADVGHTHTSAGVTDFTEAAQDAVAAAFAAGTHSGITVAYNDAANAINLTVTGGAGATNLGNTVAPTGVTITSSSGTSTTLALADATNAGLMAPAQFTKLSGIATGATANSTDAVLLARANHTGTQSAATITGLATVATTGAYADLTGKPTLGTAAAAATTDFATAAQGALAGTAVQPAALTSKADLASPALTGTPTAPTAVAGTNTTQIATTAFVSTAVSNIVNSAPATLDTLNELATALGNDANFATTTATALGLKAPLASPTFTGTPAAPTATTGTNTTQVATTAFVNASVTAAAANYATAAQGTLAGTALQPGAQLTQAAVTGATAAGVALLDAATVAAQRTALGLGTAATTAATDYATAAQGTAAGTALQPGAQLTQAAVTAATAPGVALLGAATVAAQRTALGLGTAATTAATDYATAAQGALAATALQPGSVDAVPTDASSNPVSSNGVFDALALKANTASLATVATSGAYADLTGKPTIDTAPTNGSTNAVSSDGVFDALALKADNLLTGIDTATAGTVVAADTVKQAIGKLEATKASGGVRVDLGDQATGTLSAAATVDLPGVDCVAITQTTAGAVVTLPAPTVAATRHRTLTVTNMGSVLLTVTGADSVVLAAGESREWRWNGSAWRLVAPAFTAAQTTSLQTSLAAGISTNTFWDMTRKNGGRGELACSWQVNPLQSGVTGTAFDSTSVYPEPATFPQALKPVVYQALAATGQCRAGAELAADAVTTAAQFTATLTPAAVAANTTAEQSFTVAGLTVSHVIMSVQKAAAQSGLRIVAFRCDAANTLKITYFNSTGASITPTAGETYTVNTMLPSNGAQPSLFNSLGMWARAPKRADGEAYTYCRLDLGVDSSYVDSMLSAMPVRADGKWRFYIMPFNQFGVTGTFVAGVTRWSFARLAEQGGASALTFTVAPAIGDTSATLTANFSGSTEAYPVRFSNGSVRLVSLTNGATTATWTTPLTAAATTSAIYAATMLAQGATEAVQVGPIYRDPASKAFAYVRFDDCTIDQYVARQTLSTPFVGQSGVTLPTGAYSAKDVVSAFGLKANLFIITSAPGKASGNFMSVAQMLDLQDNYGWDVCFQTHANPASQNNLGARLLGPYGYRWSTFAGGIASVDTTANTISTNASTQIALFSVGPAGLQGTALEFTGTGLPAPLTTGVKYWARPVTATSFAVYTTELDAAADTNRIDLTTTGTPATFGYRWFGSSPDSSAVLSDFQTGQALMRGWGFKAWRHYAAQQGANDFAVHQAMQTLRASGDLRIYLGTQGSTGTGTGFIPRPGIGSSAAGYGFVGGTQLGMAIGEAYTYPVCYATEQGTEQGARDYVDALVRTGSVGGNYHHFFNTEQVLRNLCAYCDQVKLRVDQGLLLTGTMTELDALRTNTLGAWS